MKNIFFIKCFERLLLVFICLLRLVILNLSFLLRSLAHSFIRSIVELSYH